MGALEILFIIISIVLKGIKISVLAQSTGFSLKMQPRLVTSCIYYIYYILTRLDYYNYLLMGTPNSVFQPVQKIQTFAARLILLAPCHYHSTPLLEKLHWLPISEHIKYKVICMFQCYKWLLAFLNCYTFTLHLIHYPLFLTPHAENPAVQMQDLWLSYFGPHIWNSLPQDLRHCSILSSFKAKLKTLVFTQYFCPN